MTRRRVLFVGEAVTLAHVARCLSLSSMLNPGRYEVHHAWDPRYNHLIGDLPDRYASIWSIPGKQFFAALSRGTPIYRTADLARYVAQDLALIDRVRPDVVVGDFRLSLDVSARLAGVRYVTVTNAYWSPYCSLRPPVPDTTLTRLAGVRVGQRLFDLGRAAVGAWHAKAFRELRRRYGLPPGVPDVRWAYTQADQTLYADLAELVPMVDLPRSHAFVGPVLWSPPINCPQWFDELPAGRPVVYLALGSSGPGRLLPVILAALADLPVEVVAATAGARIEPDLVPANAHVAEVLPADRVVRRASLVVCNGGSPASYQALHAGRPVIGICSNLDQYLNMTLVERAGAGWLLRSGRAGGPAIAQVVRRALTDGGAHARAGELAAAISRYDAADLFRRCLG